MDQFTQRQGLVETSPTEVTTNELGSNFLTNSIVDAYERGKYRGRVIGYSDGAKQGALLERQRLAPSEKSPEPIQVGIKTPNFQGKALCDAIRETVARYKSISHQTQGRLGDALIDAIFNIVDPKRTTL